jgi:2'-5' RNA ligase
MRAFLALDVGDKYIIQRIEKIQENILRSGAEVKIVEPQNLHFTVRFFGEINDVQARKIISLLEDIKLPPLKVSYSGIGFFPNLRKISIIWIGVDEICRNELIHLANKVNDNLKIFGRPDKGFKAHLTISRVKSGKNKDDLLQAISQYETKKLGEEIIEKLKLKKSTLTPKGPIYEDLHAFPLKDD